MRWQVALAVALLAAGSVSADFSDGLEAYDAGRYGDALNEWRALAALGHLDSMVAIAGLYEAGTGVAQDHRRAVDWYRRAADCGHAVAQLNLGDLYSRGRGVERDLVSADVYLSLAAAQGNGWAKDRRTEIRATMTTAQRAEAAARLSETSPRCASGPAKAAGGGS